MGSGDITAQVWDAATGEELAVLEGHTADVRSAAYSPDGARIVTVSEDTTARVWNAASGEELAVLEGHTGAVESAAFSPDGTRIVTGSEDNTARVWDAATGEELAVVKGHTGAVRSVTFSPDRVRITTVDESNTVRVWARPELDQTSLADHDEGVWWAIFDPTGRWVASAGQDGVIQISNAQTGQPAARLEGHGEGVEDEELECPQCINAISFGPSGERLASAGWDGTARIWDVQTGDELVVLRRHTGRLNDAIFSPDGTRVATSCAADGTVRLWDPGSGAELFTLQSGGSNYLEFSPDGRLVVAAGTDGRARFWDVATGGELAVLEGDGNALIYAVFSPDGERVAAAGFGGTGYVWDVETGEELATLEGHNGTILQIVYSPRGDLIATAGEDGTARIWNAETGEEQTVLHGHDRGVWSVAFRPDGEQVATGSGDGTVRLWNTRTGELEAILPDYVGTGLLVNWVVNWEAGVLEMDQPLNEWVYYVSYSPSGDRVVAANLTGSVDSYVTNTDKLLDIARTEVTRDLTCQERVQFLHEELDCEAEATSTP
jgi:WD40 repeat protein